MRVDIPSRGRPDADLHKAYFQLRFLSPTIWVRRSEKSDYLQTFKPGEIRVIDDELNISEIRDRILNYRRLKSELFVMIDDGVSLLPSKKFFEERTLSRVIKDIRNRLQDYPLCGINSPGNDGYVNESWTDFSPKYVECNFWINPDILPRSVKFSFGGSGTGEDICFNLRLALSGFMPQRYNRWKFSKRIWRAGGCSAMGRTAKTVSADSELLRSLYPEYLRPRQVVHPNGKSSTVNTLLLAKAYRHSTKKPDQNT